MTKVDYDRERTGGNAFPVNSGILDHTSGMTLRDWYAGQALMGLLAQGEHDCGPDGIAHDCYLFADAMLAARDKGNEK